MDVGGYEAAGIRGAKDITNNAPLRGGKGMLYEGGVRVPLLVRWPGVTPPETVSAEPVATIDFYPTFLEMTGAEGDPARPPEGISLMSVLREPKTARLEREALYWHFPGYLEADASQGTWRTTPCGSIRAGSWKLLEFFEDGRVELYDLKNDLGETTDLPTRRPDQTRRLREMLAAWRASVRAPMPAPR